MVVPVFGLVFNEKQRNARPIKERFLAEVRFLKKYRALDYYVKIYRRELKRDLQETAGASYNYRDIISELRKYETKGGRLQWSSKTSM
jgi:hypothetical protein